MPNMTPEQALRMLDQVVAKVDLKREEHMLIQTAVQVLADVLTKNDPAATPPEPERKDAT